jgi:hypothetical protein
MNRPINFLISVTVKGFQSRYKYPGCPAFNNNSLILLYVVPSEILTTDLGLVLSSSLGIVLQTICWAAKTW